MMAGNQGFEPWEVLPSPVFKTGVFNHSTNSPNQKNQKKEANGGDTQTRTGDKGFAGLGLTTWRCRHKTRQTK